MLLSGDDNLTMDGVSMGSGWLIPGTNVVLGYGKGRHGGSGWAVASDGAVMQLSPGRLDGMLRSSPNLTNRFLLP